MTEIVAHLYYVSYKWSEVRSICETPQMSKAEAVIMLERSRANPVYQGIRRRMNKLRSGFKLVWVSLANV